MPMLMPNANAMAMTNAKAKPYQRAMPVPGNAKWHARGNFFFIVYYLKLLVHRHHTNMHRLLATCRAIMATANVQCRAMAMPASTLPCPRRVSAAARGWFDGDSHGPVPAAQTEGPAVLRGPAARRHERPHRERRARRPAPLRAASGADATAGDAARRTAQTVPEPERTRPDQQASKHLQVTLSVARTTHVAVWRITGNRGE